MKVITKIKWLWTKKAEEFAIDHGFEPRTENTPAMLAGEELGQYAPKSWLEHGYIKEAEGELA